MCKIQVWVLDKWRKSKRERKRGRKGQREGEREREGNELYSIHYLVKDSLGKTVLDSLEWPSFLGKESLFTGDVKKEIRKVDWIQSKGSVWKNGNAIAKKINVPHPSGRCPAPKQILQKD